MSDFRINPPGGGGGSGTVTGVTATAPIVSSGGTAPDISMTNQGTTTTVLHGNAAGNPSFGQIVNADITNSTIDLTAKVTGILPPANGGVANLTAAGSGYFYSAGTGIEGITASTGVATGTANVVRAVKFVLRHRQTIRKISLRVGTNVASSALCVAIYDSAGTTKLVDAGTNAFDSTVTNTNRTVTLGVAVTLDAGEYWFAFGCTQSGVTITGSTTVNETNLVNLNSTKMGTGATNISSGNMPSSLQTVSATTFNIPAVLFEG